METQTLALPKVLVDLKEGIKTITFNYPRTKNAVSNEAGQLVLKALGESKFDGTKVIILTGAEGNFCSGADLAGQGMTDPQKYDVSTYLRTGINAIVNTIHESNIPVIAKVRGVATGVGANFALGCDMVFATEEAIFSQIFTNIALSSDGGGAYFMVQALGYKKAFELMTTAAKITGKEAAEMGLINKALKDSELDDHVQNFALTLATGPYLAIQNTKANLREAQRGNLWTTLEMEANNQGINFRSQDFAEGVMAFLQKRKPVYKGK